MIRTGVGPCGATLWRALGRRALAQSFSAVFVRTTAEMMWGDVPKLKLGPVAGHGSYMHRPISQRLASA